jgi:hypothetical protein
MAGTLVAMVEAAGRFLAALDPAQRAAATISFDDAERVSWHYTPSPYPRRGLSLAEMDRSQAKAAHRLLARGLSAAAYARVAAIVALEDVLDEREGGRRGRHAGDYWMAVFGDVPATGAGGGPWGWRFEGHHVSVNLTIAGDAVSATPSFLGANPAVIEVGGAAPVQPLAPEEELGRRFLAVLDEDQRRKAVLSQPVPGDILTGDASRADPALAPPAGIAGADLRADQVGRLRELAALYVGRAPEPAAGAELARLEQVLGDLHFTWVGDPEAGPGHPHYYRLHGPGFLVELDNTQNEANHVHSVWRDPAGDFGARMLGA